MLSRYIVGKPAHETADLGIDVGHLLDDDGWVMRYFPDEEDDKLSLYLRSFYFVLTTMSTVGYGDIGPKRTGEILCAMFVQFLGCALFGYVVGLMGSEVSGFDAHERPVNERIDFLEALFEKHKVKKDVRNRVRRQYMATKEASQTYMVRTTRGCSCVCTLCRIVVYAAGWRMQVDTVLKDLPRKMREDLTLSVFRKPASCYEMLVGHPVECAFVLAPSVPWAYAAMRCTVF